MTVHAESPARVAPIGRERAPDARRRRVHFPARTRLRPRTLDLAIAQLAAACVAIGLIEVALLLTEPRFGPHWALILWPAVAAIHLAAGVVAWMRRPSNRMGPLMILGAFIWLGAGLVNVSTPALVAAGLIVAGAPAGIVVHLLHAFPSGELRGRLSRVAVLGGWLTVVVLQAPQYLFGDPNPLGIAERPQLTETATHVQWVAGSCVVALTIVVLFRRWRRARGARRGLAPLFLYGIFAVLFVPVSAQLSRSFFPDAGVAVAVAQATVLAGVPVAFAFAMLRGGFTRTAELEELGAWLGADAAARPALAEALAGVLGDASVELAFWVGDGRFLDGDGRPVALPEPGADRAAVDVRLAGRLVGAIVYDATLIADPRLVVGAGRVIALALDNERLLVELRASHEVLRASRARIVEAADAERRRIARDLHDGLQTHLILLALKAHGIRADRSLSPAARADAEAVEAGMRDAITDLRELVHGVMPAALTERGLYAAAEDLIDRIPIPTELRLERDGAPLPRHVESTCYFVVSEALTNAVKHSCARGLEVVLEQRPGRLRLEVRDDGVGGVRTGAGAGLRGMADRVEALDGRLLIDSPPGGGTRVVAELPCAS